MNGNVTREQVGTGECLPQFGRQSVAAGEPDYQR